MKYLRRILVAALIVCLTGCGGTESGGEKRVVHMATLRPETEMTSNFQQALASFNEENSDYCVEVTCYKDETSLQLAIVGGAEIDVVDLYHLSTDLYISGGLLADLYSYLDADEDINREDFVPAFLAMAEEDGALPFLSASFAVRTLMAPKSLVPNQQGWTVNEYLETVKQLPAGTYIMEDKSGLDFFSLYLTYTIQNYVNLKTDVLNLRQADFMNMLEYCRDGYVDSAHGDTPLLSYMNTIFGPDMYLSYLREQAEEYTLIGFPGASGNGALRYFGAEQLAILSNAGNGNGAWEFLKYFIQWERTGGIGFPVLQTNFDRFIQDAMEDTRDENGNIVEAGMTEAERDSLLEWINNASGPGGSENTSEVISIMLEEASAYLSGEKSMDDVLRIMENRLQIYLSEKG